MFITVGERLKDLRVEKGLTLRELSKIVNISHSALSNYENDKQTDISPFSLTKLAEFYDVSLDYIMGLSEQKKRNVTPIEDLNISDEMIEILKEQPFNTQLLSKMVTHEKFIQFMIDIEIFIDSVIAGTGHAYNGLLANARKKVTDKYGMKIDEQKRILEIGKIDESLFVRQTIHEDLDTIINDLRKIREINSPPDIINNATIQIENTFNQILKDSEEYKYGPDDLISLLARLLGIDYDKLSFLEKKSFKSLFKKSTLLNKQSYRGKSDN